MKIDILEGIFGAITVPAVLLIFFLIVRVLFCGPTYTKSRCVYDVYQNGVLISHEDEMTTTCFSHADSGSYYKVLEGAR